MEKINDAESKDKTIGPVDPSNPAIDEIILYLRASYVVLEKSAVIKTSQDISYNVNGKERYILYFFIGPEPGQS